MEKITVCPKENLDVVDDARAVLLLIDAALDHKNDTALMQSVLRKAKHHIKKTADCLARATIAVETLMPNERKE